MSMAPTRVRRPVDPSPDAQRRLRATPAPKPDLKVVPAPASKHRFGRRVLVTMAIAAALLTPFALVLVHVELTANQLHLTSLQTKGDDAQAQYEKLRLQVAQLASPSRVVANAQQLGMVTPTTITYLTPAPVSVPTNPTNPTNPSITAPPPAGPGVDAWSAAKRVDAGR
jgi:cell division protein FtsL